MCEMAEMSEITPSYVGDVMNTQQMSGSDSRAVRTSSGRTAPEMPEVDRNSG